MSSRPTRWLALCLLLACAFPLAAWGPRGHELVNQYAIDTLPPELRPFFEAHRQWLIDSASAPDAWKENDSEEAPHHFIDIERYAKKFDRMPASREEAVEAVGADYVKDSGDIIWYLPLATRRLAAAMKDGDREQILHWAVAVAHYAGDISQPLHTTENYDGQLSGQKGVHSRFETLAVNRVAGSLQLNPKPARALPSVFDAVFTQIRLSYRRLPDILEADGKAMAADPQADAAYTALMASLTRDLIREQLEAGATLTGSLWLTAWNEAGRPDLDALGKQGQ